MTPLALAVLLLGCSSSEVPEAAEPEVAAPEAPEPEPEPEPARPTADEVDWSAALKNPALANVKAPETFKVKLETTKGDVVIEVKREWAPIGADRFYNLVMAKYYDDVAFFRTVEGFMAQFGIHGDPAVNRAWRSASIRDEPVVQSNTRGMVTFAKTGFPDSRTTQLFINYRDNQRLDGMGFSPFGKVVEGMDVVDSLHVTGEAQPAGPGPAQGQIVALGNDYLRDRYPDLDYIKSASVLE